MAAELETHRLLTLIISEHLTWLGIEPSTKPRVTGMYSSHNVVPAVAVDYAAAADEDDDAVDYADDDYYDGDY